MTQDQIQNFLLQKGRYLPQKKIYNLTKQLEGIDPARTNRVLSSPTKNPTLFTILYWLLPFMWITDRFFTAQYFTGVIKLLFPLIFLVLIIVFNEGTSYIMIANKPIEQWFGLAMVLFYPLWILFDGFTIGGRIKNHNYQNIIQALK